MSLDRVHRVLSNDKKIIEKTLYLEGGITVTKILSKENI